MSQALQVERHQTQVDRLTHNMQYDFIPNNEKYISQNEPKSDSMEKSSPDFSPIRKFEKQINTHPQPKSLNQTFINDKHSKKQTKEQSKYQVEQKTYSYLPKYQTYYKSPLPSNFILQSQQYNNKKNQQLVDRHYFSYDKRFLQTSDKKTFQTDLKYTQTASIAYRPISTLTSPYSYLDAHGDKNENVESRQSKTSRYEYLYKRIQRTPKNNLTALESQYTHYENPSYLSTFTPHRPLTFQYHSNTEITQTQRPFTSLNQQKIVNPTQQFYFETFKSSQGQKNLEKNNFNVEISEVKRPYFEKKYGEKRLLRKLGPDQDPIVIMQTNWCSFLLLLLVLLAILGLIVFQMRQSFDQKQFNKQISRTQNLRPQTVQTQTIEVSYENQTSISGPVYTQPKNNGLNITENAIITPTQVISKPQTTTNITKPSITEPQNTTKIIPNQTSIIQYKILQPNLNPKVEIPKQEVSSISGPQKTIINPQVQEYEIEPTIIDQRINQQQSPEIIVPQKKQQQTKPVIIEQPQSASAEKVQQVSASQITENIFPEQILPSTVIQPAIASTQIQSQTFQQTLQPQSIEPAISKSNEMQTDFVQPDIDAVTFPQQIPQQSIQASRQQSVDNEGQIQPVKQVVTPLQQIIPSIQQLSQETIAADQVEPVSSQELAGSQSNYAQQIAAEVTYPQPTQTSIQLQPYVEISPQQSIQPEKQSIGQTFVEPTFTEQSNQIEPITTENNYEIPFADLSKQSLQPEFISTQPITTQLTSQPAQPTQQQPVYPIETQLVQPIQESITPIEYQTIEPKLQQSIQPILQEPIQPIKSQFIKPTSQQIIYPVQQPSESVQPISTVQQPTQKVIQMQSPPHAFTDLQNVVPIKNYQKLTIIETRPNQSPILLQKGSDWQQLQKNTYNFKGHQLFIIQNPQKNTQLHKRNLKTQSF